MAGDGGVAEIAAFSDHERKLFRRRLILSPVIAVATASAAVPYLLQASAGWYLLTAAALLVLFITGPGLLVTEHQTDLKRFDAMLDDAHGRAVAWLRGVRISIRYTQVILSALMTWYEPAIGSRPIIWIFVLSQFVAAWLFRREAAIARTVAQLTP